MAQNQGSVEMEDDWQGFGIHTITVLGRSVVSYGLNTFIPIFWLLVLRQSETVSNSSLSLFLIIGVFANIMGGRLADRYGYQRVIRGCFLALTPLLFWFALTDSKELATVLVMLLSLCIHGAYTPMVALGQRFLPNQVGLASGVMMGLAGSFGGLMAPLLGWIGDNYSITLVFILIGSIAVITTIMTFFVPPLPKERQANKLNY
jgi:FSR family fosmidomycin resistance protein-like MFS transporter